MAATFSYHSICSACRWGAGLKTRPVSGNKSGQLGVGDADGHLPNCRILDFMSASYEDRVQNLLSFVTAYSDMVLGGG